jgi:hypothetical protein
MLVNIRLRHVPFLWSFRLPTRSNRRAPTIAFSSSSSTISSVNRIGPRVRLWKWELQKFANRTGLSITVCHFPPGTSKWNKIEHRLFSHIAMNWRGKPLVSLVAIVSLIGSTKTAAGLRVRSELDRGKYPMGVVVTDEQCARIRMTPHTLHGDWNYTIRPTRRRRS